MTKGHIQAMNGKKGSSFCLKMKIYPV